MSERPSGWARAKVWIGGLLLIVALALVPVWLGWDRGVREPAVTATDEPADPQATAPGVEPAEVGPEPTETDRPDDDSGGGSTPQPEASPTSIPTAEPETVALLAGRAALEDPRGDVLRAAGEPAQGASPAADLVRVELEGAGEELTITWTVAGDVPASVPGSLLWSVDLWSGDELAASVTVQQIGSRRVAGVLDWSTGAQTAPPDDAEVQGAVVRLRVPIGALPAVGAPLTWQALGQDDGGLEDRAPDDGRADGPG